MSKKKIISAVLGLALAMGVFSGCGTGSSQESASNTSETVLSSESNVETISADTETEAAGQATEDNGNSEAAGNTLVVYYSAQGHTVKFAEAIADELDADLFELVPEEIYSNEDLDWTNGNSRVSQEHDDESLRDIALVSTEVENWESYDTVYIGYPIWWGIAAWPVDNFVKNNDFTGKTVIPFATSSSSGMGESGEILAEYAGTGEWLEGRRFQSNEDVVNAREWAAALSN